MKRGKSSIWPMEYILGGIFVAAALVLLVYGLQSRSPRDTAQAPSATEDTATRSESSVRLPAPEQIADIAAENPVQQAGDRNGTIASAEPALAAEGALQGPEPVSFAEAESHFHAADFSQAAEGFRSYVLAHPGNPWGHYMLGLSEWRGGDAAAAEGALQRALEIDPGHAKAMVNLGRVLLDLDRPGDAIAVLDEAVAIDPASATAHRVRARALHDLGRSTDAIAAYRGALGLDPADAWSLNNLGLILIEAERFVRKRAHGLLLTVDWLPLDKDRSHQNADPFGVRQPAASINGRDEAVEKFLEAEPRQKMIHDRQRSQSLRLERQSHLPCLTSRHLAMIVSPDLEQIKDS